jgi:hypothetical protein
MRIDKSANRRLGKAKRATVVPNRKPGGRGARAPTRTLVFHGDNSPGDQFLTVMQEMSERFKARHTASA